MTNTPISTTLTSGLTISTETQFIFGWACAARIDGDMLIIRDELVCEIVDHIDGELIVTVEDYALFLAQDYIDDLFLKVWKTAGMDNFDNIVSDDEDFDLNDLPVAKGYVTSNPNWLHPVAEVNNDKAVIAVLDSSDEYDAFEIDDIPF